MSSNLFDLALEATWAIDAAEDAEGRPYGKLRQILEIAGREHRKDELDALQFQESKPLPQSERSRERDGVAIVPIIGPTFPRANLMTELSGATSLQMVGSDVRTALDDPRIKGVILDFDTPGGTFNGTNEAAKFIAGLAEQSDKPIVAYVGGLAASAGYWLASAIGRGRVMVDESASLGSIGVVLAMVDTSGRDQARGVREFQFVSSQSPLKRPDPETDQGRAALQAQADEAAQIFIEAVAVNRGVSVDTVINDFGQGGTLFGKAAVRAGMADQIASFEEVLAAVAGGEFGGPAVGRTMSLPARELSTMSGIKTAAQLEAAYPELAGEIKAAARKEGETEGFHKAREELVEAAEASHEDRQAKAVAEARDEATKAERERIVGLKAASLPGHEAELEAAIEDGSTAADLALKIVKAQQQSGNAHLGQLDKDREALKGKLPDGREEQQPAGEGGDPQSHGQVIRDGQAVARQLGQIMAEEKERSGRDISPDEAAVILQQGQAA